MDELPPYVSMVDVLENDYNAKYEAWKAAFYHDNMTDEPPDTIGGMCRKTASKTYYKKYASHENDIIKFLVVSLIVIGVIFWLIPAMYYAKTGTPNVNIGTLDALEDIFKPVQSGVYILDGGTWREASEDEING